MAEDIAGAESGRAGISQVVSLADETVLDHPVWSSLTGPHAHFAERYGRAVRYPSDMSPFAAVSPDGDESVWDDLAALAGPGTVVAVIRGELPHPADWELELIDGVQMIDVSLRAEDHQDVESLTPDDVPEMLELVRRAQPGPFLHGTPQLGSYLGIRRGRALVAMAGQRMHPTGWTEISAVCTDVEHRNQGLAAILVRAVAADIRSRGETPFLHVAASNTKAIRLYEALGFAVRRQVSFDVLRVPE